MPPPDAQADTALPERVPLGATVVTDIPTRLDRLGWSPWHWRVVIGLGITWILDGLETSLIGAVASILTHPTTLHLRPSQVGDASAIYLVGEIVGALVFGRWTDAKGRKKLFLVTLGVYLVGTALSGAASGFALFAVCRFVAGMGIGGEYAAINSAIDELIPARLRGQVDLTINGSFWIGAAMGGLLTEVLLNPRLLPYAIGWRLVFGLGASLGVAILVVRKTVPESPRWLLMHGRVREADEVVTGIERAVREGAPGAVPAGPPPRVPVTITGTASVARVARVLLQKHARRSALGLALMVSQSFFYNAIFFTFGLILVRFYGVREDSTGRYLVPFALGNFLGPLVLGRLFDTVGRRRMIAGTYGLAGAILLATGALFRAGALTTNTQVLCWCVGFFFASAAASSAYLTVSELFPVELRATAIALFFCVAQAAGATGAATFGRLTTRDALFHGYVVAAAAMLLAAAVGATLGVNAERKTLEQLVERDPATEPPE